METAEGQYDGFRHFIASIGVEADTLMAMFTLYCDDSGTHPKSDIAVAACYVSTVEQWEHFKRNWREVNDQENFGTFHMADFVARQEQFAESEWQDDDKRARTIRALIGTIKLRVQFGFSAAVVKSAFDEVAAGASEKVRKQLGDNHYAFAIRLCTAMVNKWRDQYGHREPIQYVFDRMSEGKGDVDRMFGIYVKGQDDALRRYGVYKDCWSFQDKAQVVQLQAADIWAYESYRYMRDCFIPGDGTKLDKTPRRSYAALREIPVYVRYHVKHTLQDLDRRAQDFLD